MTAYKVGLVRQGRMQVWCGIAWNEPYPVLSPCRNPDPRCRWLNAPCANHRDMNTGQPLTIREAVSEHVFRLMDSTNAELLLKVGALGSVGGVGGVTGVAGVRRCCCACTCWSAHTCTSYLVAVCHSGRLRTPPLLLPLPLPLQGCGLSCKL